MSEKDALLVQVDPDMCMGSSFCVHAAPNVFAQREDGTSGVRTGDAVIDGPVQVQPQDTKATEQAATVCPAQAILLSGGTWEAGQ